MQGGQEEAGKTLLMLGLAIVGTFGLRALLTSSGIHSTVGTLSTDIFKRLTSLFGFESGMGTKLLMSKVVGTSIVVASALMRLPQILKIFRDRSAKGVSLESYYLELPVMLNVWCYAKAHDMSFSLYGENAILSFQSIVIISQIWFYNKSVNSRHKIIAGSFFAAYFFLIMGGLKFSEPVW